MRSKLNAIEHVGGGGGEAGTSAEAGVLYRGGLGPCMVGSLCEQTDR